MSTLEWRREQPRVNPPRHPAMFWIDLVLISMIISAALMHVIIFAIDGWPGGLVCSLWSGWIVARFYPFN